MLYALPAPPSAMPDKLPYALCPMRFAPLSGCCSTMGDNTGDPADTQ